jgi:hypothetical protein
MSGNQPFQETTAVELAGFTEILWTIAQRILGSTQRPKYEVYEERTSATLREYWATVHIYLNSEARDALFHFTGRSAPTTSMAIQLAAWEAIARLRHQLRRMNRRPFHFYPSRAALDGDTSFVATHHEEDLAVVHLTRYLAAQHDLFVQALDSLAMARRVIAHLHTHLAPQSAPPSPRSVLDPVSSPEEPLLGIPVVEGNPRRRHADMTDYLGLFASYTATSRAEHRRRRLTSPPNSPASTRSRANGLQTRPSHLDVNQVD